MTAADIFGRPLSAKQQADLKRLAALPDEQIDFSDIPELTDEQLANMRPARDFEAFRRWQDQHATPEQIAKFEEARRRWHERNDPKK